jgi:hypothetical protein
MNGWWKFHRAMLDHPVWKLPHAQRSVWIAILTKVNHTNKDWFDGVQRVELGPGEMITSQEHLAEMAGTTRQVVRDTLTALLRLGTIGTKTRTKRYTQITVVNWPIYQGQELDENQEENHKRTKREPSENQARTIAGEGKNEEKVKKGRRNTLLANPDEFAAFWSAYPKKLGKAQAEKAWCALNPQNGLADAIIASVQDHLTCDQWRDPQYIPYPASFLNGRRWEDVLCKHESLSERLWREAQEEKRDDTERSVGGTRGGV